MTSLLIQAAVAATQLTIMRFHVFIADVTSGIN